MMEEPSVLDYLKSKLNPWSKQKIDIPASTPALAVLAAPEVSEAVADIDTALSTELSTAPGMAVFSRIGFPWRATSALVLALLAQLSLEPAPTRSWQTGLILYLLAVGFVVVSAWRGEWLLAPYPADQEEPQLATRAFSGLRGCLYWGLAATLAAVAFVSFGDNRFTTWNTALWAISLVLLVLGLWQPRKQNWSWWQSLDWLRRAEWSLRVDRWHVLLLLAVGLVVFFRVYQLEQVPPEMVSDHAEKLLDVWDVNHGQTKIFFERNTGREALQMYLTAAIIQLFNTGYSYLSLKIGTVLAGLLTLPYIYLLGKEAGGRRTGLFALIFAGIAYWPNVISRVGLRFPLYPLFVAPVLFYLIRGLRRMDRNDFILAGLFLGVGLHGYTPIRILPFLVVLGIVLYWLYARSNAQRSNAQRSNAQRSNAQRSNAITGLMLITLLALVVFLPLLRFSLENPDLFAFRSFSRLGTVERPLPGPAWLIFSQNLWRALTMFAWDDGEIWVNSVAHRPALDVVSAALFYLGAALLFYRLLRERHWLDAFLLLAVPVLMLPSILALAFPAENPAPNRMAGAIVPVFVIVGLALDGLLAGLQRRLSEKLAPSVVWGLSLVLVFVAARQNYELVFTQYQQTYTLSSWNTSEMGKVIHDFAHSVGSEDTAWVLAFPHWVDTRLVGINAGYPLRDYAIAIENLATLQSETRTRLILVKPDDADGLQMLQSLFPNGTLQTYDSNVDGHDFYMFFIPASSPVLAE